MKSKFINIIILTLCFCNIKAQIKAKPQNLPRYDNKKIHFGFTIGINSLDFNILHNPEIIYKDSLYALNSKSQKGFNLGIVSNFRLGRYTDLRFIPALVFGERKLIYYFSDSINLNGSKAVESTLIDFPLYIKYKSKRYHNFRTFVLCGVKYSLDIASQKDIIDEDNIVIKLNPHDLLGEIGVGMDFYLEFFKFSTQLKLSSGIINIIDKDQTIYTQSINKLLSKGWVLSFTFE
tara:strand:- start:9275 stop:9976 length:702 start_codon:yes stop_codon:yes gene_type:complete